jgi:kumamolisin
MATQKVPLAGSELQPLGTRTGDQPSDEMIEVSVLLRPRVRAPAPPGGAPRVSRAEFAAKHGADEKVVEQVRRFAQEFNLTVSEVSVPRRTVKLKARAADLVRAFDVKLSLHEESGHRYRCRTGAIYLPADLAPHVEAVLGFDDRPQAQPHFRVRPSASSSNISYTPRQVAGLYQFPLDVDGTGETVGILELGGGYKTADLQNYFSSLGLAVPDVIDVLVDGATNSPSDANSADGEVLLDIEVVGAVAPGAKIVVYFAPNTSQGFQDALTTAIHDTTNKTSVISISWGGAESTWTVQAMTAFDSAAQDAAALGVTICAASGDDGSSDGVDDGKNHVDFPASSPYILACGGTSLKSSGAQISGETAWNDGAQGGAGGGGYSNQFALPSYQSGAGIKAPTGSGRGVPDVSADADPETGYQVLVDGESLVIGGTSAAAPLWSALIALINEKRGSPVGFLQPAIYGLPSSADAFHDITSGSNGVFSAGLGWDPVTGLGSPAGENLTAALLKASAGKAT